MTTSDRIRVRPAYAKINLALSVGPPLPPGGPFAGYHPIASWMSSIDLADEVTVERLEGSGPSVYEVRWAPDAPRPSPIDWPIEKDLAVRAHTLIEERVQRTLPVRLTVTKRTPVGGGLGGGSSDAAAAMLAIREAFDLEIPDETLASLSAKLGSDVGFFIAPDRWAPTAIVSNLGDRIERIGGVSEPVVLFFPPFGCPTGPVYKAFDARPGAKIQDERVQRIARDAAKHQQIDSAALFNDLAFPATVVEPRLADVLATLERGLGMRVHVTGSGSTMFVLPGTPSKADDVCAVARKLCPDVAVVATKTLP